jgi:hypothetical protein
LSADDIPVGVSDNGEAEVEGAEGAAAVEISVDDAWDVGGYGKYYIAAGRRSL